MKKRIKRLELLLNLKEKAQEKRLTQLALCQKKMQEAQQKYNQLVSYRGEYVERLNEQGKTGANMSTFRHHVDFIAQLDFLIEQQLLEYNSLQKQAVLARKDYLQSKHEVKSIELLMDKALSELTESENRLLQKQCDETIQNQWYYRNNCNEESYRDDVEK